MTCTGPTSPGNFAFVLTAHFLLGAARHCRSSEQEFSVYGWVEHRQGTRVTSVAEKMQREAAVSHAK